MTRIIGRVLTVIFILSAILFGWNYIRLRLLRDFMAPVIVMEQNSITVSVKDSEDVLLQGIKAVDAKDGDVSDSLVLQGLTNFVETGRRQAVIAAFDNDNNVSKVTREIVYSDYEPPRFSLNYPLNFRIGMQESELIHAIQAVDCLDGDLTDSVSVELADDGSWLDASIEGDTRIIYRVVNSCGDVAELPATIHIYDQDRYNRALHPVLSSYLVYLNVNDSFDPWSMITGMEKNGELIDIDEEAVSIDDPVDTSHPGVYEVTYQTSDDGYVTKIRLIVVVE